MQKQIIRDVYVLSIVALIFAALAFYIHFDFFRDTDSILNARAITDGRKIPLSRAEGLSKEQKVLWVDARSEEAFGKEHIPGAVLLNEDRWEFFLEGFFATWNGEPIIVYCSDEGCRTSQRVADRLSNELGVAEVFILDGGFDGWKNRQK